MSQDRLIVAALVLASVACTAHEDSTARSEATSGEPAKAPVQVPAETPAPVEQPTAVPEPSVATATPTIASAPPSPPPVLSIPSWCSVETRVVTPVDEGSFVEVVQTVKPSASDHAALCSSFVSRGPSTCSAEGPWFVIHDDLEIALVVPLSGGQFGRIPELGIYSDGTEVSSLVSGSQVWSSRPTDAWLHISEAEEECGVEGDDELCGLVGTYDRHILIFELAGDRFLVIEVSVDMQDEAMGERMYTDASIEVEDGMVEVEACDGHVRLPLPPGEREFDWDEDEDDEDDAADEESLPPASADEAKAAGKRCGEGWSKFQAGDLTAAKLDVDAALTVLERATDERGLRSLGACLYNRGRIAEQEGDLEQARELYRRSLAARPNDTVQARLDSLRAP